MSSDLLVDPLHVQPLCSGVEVSQSALVGGVFAVEVVLLCADEALRAAAGVCRLADRAGPGGRRFVGSPLRVAGPVVGATDAVVCPCREEKGGESRVMLQ